MKKEYKAHFLMLTKTVKPFIVVWVFNRLRDIFFYLIKKEISNVFLREVILLILLIFVAERTLKSYVLALNKDSVCIKKGFILKRCVIIELSNISSFHIIRRPLNVITKSTKFVFGCETDNLKKRKLYFTMKKDDAETLIKCIKNIPSPNNISGETL